MAKSPLLVPTLLAVCPLLLGGCVPGTHVDASSVTPSLEPRRENPYGERLGTHLSKRRTASVPSLSLRELGPLALSAGFHAPAALGRHDAFRFDHPVCSSGTS